MSTDITLNDLSVLLQGDQLIAESYDLILDHPSQRGSDNTDRTHRRALRHDDGDKLTINYDGDYPGGVNIAGKIVQDSGYLYVETYHLVLDHPSRRNSDNTDRTHRRALTHDDGDKLTINAECDYPGGVVVQSPLHLAGTLACANDIFSDGNIVSDGIITAKHLNAEGSISAAGDLTCHGDVNCDGSITSNGHINGHSLSIRTRDQQDLMALAADDRGPAGPGNYYLRINGSRQFKDGVYILGKIDMEDELRVGKKIELKTSIAEADEAEVTITKDGIKAHGVITANSFSAGITSFKSTNIEPGVIRVRITQMEQGSGPLGIGIPRTQEFDLVAKFLELQATVAELEKKLDALSGGLGPHSRP